MSIAPREAKCRSLPWSCAGQDRFEQRVIAPSRCASAPQAGQCVGILNSGSPPGGRASTMTRTISGMTSPARRARDGTEPPALVLGIDLQHAAVDLVRNLVPPREQVPVPGPHLIERLAALVLGVGPEAQLPQLCELVPVRGEDEVAGIADVVEEDGERPLRGLARIELPE